MYDPKTKGISQTHNVRWADFTPSTAMDMIYPPSDDDSFADNEDDGEAGDDDYLMTVFFPGLEAGRKEYESDDDSIASIPENEDNGMIDDIMPDLDAASTSEDENQDQALDDNDDD